MTTTTPPRPASTAGARRSTRPRDPRVLWGVRGLAVAAAVFGAASDVAPTGSPVIDRLWAAGAAAVLVLLASRATRNSWLWMTAVTAVFAVGSWAVIPAVGALVVAAASTMRPLRPRLYGAVVGALGAVALLDLPSVGPHGTTALIAAVAVAPVLRAGYRRSPRSARAIMRRVAAAAIVAVVVAAGVAAAVAALSAAALARAVADAEEGLELVRDGEQTEGARHFDESADEFERAEGLLGGWWTRPALAIPVVAQHTRAMEAAASSGGDLARTAEVAASVAPYRDLKAESGTVDLAAVRAMQEPVADAADALQEADRRLASARSPWLVPGVDDALARFQAEVDDALPEAVIADRALTVGPAMLGADGPRRYLVLFTSPAETRNLGGFTGSYGVLTAVAGDVDFTVSGAVNDLSRSSDWQARQLTGQDEFLARYGRYHAERNFQNLTASPDMETTAAVAGSLYQQTTGETVDGVVVVDPHAIAALLELTGPVEVEGLDAPLTADNAAVFLLRDQYVLFEGERDERKDRLEDAGRATFDALTERDLPGPRELGRVLGPVVDQKRLMFFPTRPEEQELLELTGALGRFEVPADSDFVSLRTANARPNKIDAYLERDLDYSVRYRPSTGTVQATATITLRNTAPSGGLPGYVIGPDSGGVPLGTSRLFAALYTPLQARSATLDGETIGLASERELGVNVFSRLVTIPPGATVVLVVELEGVIDMGDDYRLTVSSQPVANPDGLSVSVAAAEGGPDVVDGEGLSVDDGIGRGDEDRWNVDRDYVASFG